MISAFNDIPIPSSFPIIAYISFQIKKKCFIKNN